MERYRYQGSPPGGGHPESYQAVASNYGSNVPDNAAYIMSLPYVLPCPRPGTPQYMFSGWDGMSAPSPSFPVSYEPAAKCTNCFTLGCELKVSRDCLSKISTSLAAKVNELSKFREDLEFCKKELDSCHSMVQNLKQEATFHSQELDSCYNKIEKLEEEKKESYEKFYHLTEKFSELEARSSSYEERCNVLTQELQKFQHNNNNYHDYQISSPLNCNGAATEPIHHIPRQKSSNMQPRSSTGYKNQYETAENVCQKASFHSSRSRTGSYQTAKNSWGNDETIQVKSVASKELHESNDWNPIENHPKRPIQTVFPQDKPLDRQQDCSARYLSQATSGLSEDGTSTDISLVGLLKEVHGDLFDMPPEYALAHCVGSDFIMSSGVAVTFRKKFKSVAELLDQNKNPGQVAFVNKSGQYIYYLVTKLASTGKPKWGDFEKSVIEWRKLCVEHGVKRIAIPKIGCGRDQLDWGNVRNLLDNQFANTGIEVTVCIIECESAPEKKWSLKLCHSKEPLSQLDPRDCALVFIASKDHYITPQINRLAMKFGFMADYSANQWGMGSLYHYRNKTMDANIFGLVVRESYKDPVSFCAISKCLQDLKRVVVKSEFGYMGFEAFDDPQFSAATRKVWTVITDVFFHDDIEVHLCWPEDVEEKCWDGRELGHANQ